MPVKVGLSVWEEVGVSESQSSTAVSFKQRLSSVSRSRLTVSAGILAMVLNDGLSPNTDARILKAETVKGEVTPQRR